MQINLHLVKPQYVQNELVKFIGSLPGNVAAQYSPSVLTAALFKFLWSRLTAV